MGMDSLDNQIGIDIHHGDLGPICRFFGSVGRAVHTITVCRAAGVRH